MRVLSSTGWNVSWYNWRLVGQHVSKALKLYIFCGVAIPLLGIYYREIIIDVLKDLAVRIEKYKETNWKQTFLKIGKWLKQSLHVVYTMYFMESKIISIICITIL